MALENESFDILLSAVQRFVRGQRVPAESHREEQVEVPAELVAHILFPATAGGKNLALRVATLPDRAQISDATQVISPDTCKRPIHGGNAIATVQSSDAIKVITVRTTGFDPAVATGCSRSVERLAAVADSGSSAFLRSSEKFTEVLPPLADRLGAALGAPRAAVDPDHAPNNGPVGQTGKIVAPQLYSATGISRSIQHLARMKDSRLIVAINQHPEAPIFSVADHGLEADLFTSAPEVAAAI